LNRQKTLILGRYSGPRKAFDTATWIQDLIVADIYPVVKHKFSRREQLQIIEFPDESRPTFSTTSSPSPSPSAPCPKNNNEVSQLFFSNDCNSVADTFCLNPGLIGNLISSVCPESCLTCPTAQRDNDQAALALFGMDCSGNNMTECTCSNIASTLGYCGKQSNETDIFSQFLSYVCPETCHSWKTISNLAQFAIEIETSAQCLISEKTEIISHHYLENYVISFLVSRDLLSRPSIDIASNGKETVFAVPTIIYFGASWCQQSRKFTPTWDRFTLKHASDTSIALGFLDASSNEDLVKMLGIEKVPTIAYFSAGQQIESISHDSFYQGENSATELENWMKLKMEQKK